MAENDDLSEVGFGIELTGNSAKATFKSRWLSAFDKLWARRTANKIEPVNKATLLQDAVTQVEAQLIAAAGKRLVSDVEGSSDLALRTLQHFSSRAVHAQDRLETVAEFAHEELKAVPPTQAQLDAGPAVLSEEFVERWERAAEMATTEEAQRRWAKVMAQEIRVPGTFSARGLRTIDETDRRIAELFSDLCKLRIKERLAIPLLRTVELTDLIELEAAGLITDHGSGVSAVFVMKANSIGEAVWIMTGEDFALSLPHDIQPSMNGVLRWDKQRPTFRVKILTPVGREIATLFPVDELAVTRSIAKLISTDIQKQVIIYHRGNTAPWEAIEVVHPGEKPKPDDGPTIIVGPPKPV